MGQEIGYCRRVLFGILRFANQQEQCAWQFRDGPPDPELLPALSRWRPDGVIAHLYDRHLAGGLERMGCPVVSTTDTLNSPQFPLVDVDNRQVGRDAARYLMTRGFKHFAYLGSRSARFSVARWDGFCESLAEAGRTADSFSIEFLPKPPLAELWRPASGRLENWLEGLSKPVAVFCSNDLPARRVAEACLARGLRVPDEVAILGVDNDVSECRLANPHLSSIDTPSEKIGYEAARMLAEIMEGRTPPNREIFVVPLPVVTRASTDRFATAEPTVKAALELIQEKASTGIQVDDVSRAVGISRRQLERRFRAELDRTILAVIHESKVDRAKLLLLESELPIAEIAERTGFADAKRFNVVFKKQTEMSPRDYRKNLRPPNR